MKNKFLFLMVIFTAVLIVSCSKNKGSQAPEAKTPIENAQTASSVKMEPGYVLRINSGFYVMDNDTGSEDDKTKWAASMSLGEKLFVGESRRAVYSSDGAAYNYVKVRRENGTEGFALAMQIAAGGQLAVVIDEKANLYKSPKTVDVSSIIIPRKTVIVIYPETENGGFVQIKGYDPESQSYIRTDTNYIRLSSVSRKESDIQSSILLQTALPLKNEGNEKIRRDALLESAMLDYPESVFYAEIFEVAIPNTTGVIDSE